MQERILAPTDVTRYARPLDLGSRFDERASRRERRQENENIHGNEQRREPVSAQEALHASFVCSCNFGDHDAHA
jgi:hypothetical protein